MEVFWDVFWQHIHTSHRFNLIRFSGKWSQSSDKLNWPSWLPDFSDRRVTAVGVLPFSAASMSAFHVTSISMHENEVEVLGFKVATISSVEALEIQSFNDVADFVRARGLDQLRASSYPNGETNLNAYMQALAMSRLKRRFNAIGVSTWRKWEDAIVHLASNNTGLREHGLAGRERHTLDFLNNSSFSSTDEGYVGLSHPFVRTGKHCP
jgi:hypothetical protein